MTLRKILSREFVFTFFAQFTLSLGFCLCIPTLPIYLSRLESTEVQIGVLIGVLSLSALVFRPVVGRSLPRISERAFMISGALLFALTSAAYLLASPFWPFLVVRIVQGIGLAFFFTASVTLIANISPEAHRGQSLTYFYMAFNLAFALAPYFGMLLINRLGFTFLFLVCTVLSLFSLLIAMKLKKREGQIEASGDGERSFFSVEVLPPSLIAFLAHIIWGAIMTFFPLYALECKVTNPGLFYATFAAVLITARAFGGVILDRYRRENVILPCLTAFVVSMILFAFSKTIPMFILVAVIWGIGSAFLFPALLIWTLDLAGSARGPAMGTFTALQDLGAGIGPVIMGLVLRFTSYRTMFLCLALMGAFNWGYFYYVARKKI